MKFIHRSKNCESKVTNNFNKFNKTSEEYSYAEYHLKNTKSILLGI